MTSFIKATSLGRELLIQYVLDSGPWAAGHTGGAWHLASVSNTEIGGVSDPAPGRNESWSVGSPFWMRFQT